MVKAAAFQDLRAQFAPLATSPHRDMAMRYLREGCRLIGKRPVEAAERLELARGLLPSAKALTELPQDAFNGKIEVTRKGGYVEIAVRSASGRLAAIIKHPHRGASWFLVTEGNADRRRRYPTKQQALAAAERLAMA
jgi:hypothetical protein